MASSILQIPFRHTTTVSLSSAIKQYISSKYDQSPEMFVDDLRMIDSLRQDAITVQEPHASGLKRLQAYAAQLRWIGGKFPIDIGVEFAWYPALGYNTSQPITQNNLRFELANILFNLAALYSQLAFATNRTTSEGLKSAAQYLCAAAGTLQFLRTEILPDMRSTPPEDMDEFTLQSLEKLCLAQAQEAYWSKAVKDGLKDATIARLAAKVSDYYAEAGDFAIKSDAISTEHIHHTSAKQHHFAAAAQYRQSRDCLERRKYGEEVARLQDSIVCVNEALKESRWINRVVLGDLNGLKNRVTEDLKRAEKDNDMIYLLPVPNKADLKLLGRADMVGATTPPKEVADGVSMLGDNATFGQPLFSKLVPYSVHIAASIYSDRRDRLVNNTIIAELEAMTARLRDLLQSLNLPGSLQAIEKPLGLPPSLVSKAEELRQQDGLYRLKRSMEDTATLKANDQNIFEEGRSLLKTEQDEDNRARAKFGTDRWSRPTSENAAQKLWTQSNEIEGYLKSAASSDRLVDQKLKDSKNVIEILTGTNSDLERYVPSSRRVSLTAEVEREVHRLSNCLHEVTRLEARRRRKAQTLIEKAKADDIGPALRKETGRLEREFPMQKIEASQFEDLFEERLQAYEVDMEVLKDEQADQDELSQRIQEANSAFVNARKGDTSTAAREKVLQELENGYVRYKEIVSNLDVGRKFYNDLATIVTRFRDGCKAFVHQRRVEASHLEADITSQNLSRLNLDEHSSALQAQKSQDKERSRPPPPTTFSHPSQHQDSPLPAPQPTRAAPPSIAPMSGTWQPDMGIKFAMPANQAVKNPHVPAYPEARKTGTWDQGSSIRFS